MEKDTKHPGRWKKAVPCRTAYAGPGKKAFKKFILEACIQRNDDIANQVRVRVEGALSDLHAVDARYHVNCMASFMSPKFISAAKNASKEDENTDPAFDEVIGDHEMLKDKSRLWNSVELYHQYQLFGRKALPRRSLLVKIQHHFLDDIAVLSSPGLSSLVVFRQNASTVLHLAGDTEDDTQDLLIGNLAKIICDEVKQIDHDQSRYNIRITNCSKNSVLPLKVLCSAILSERRAKQLDIAFLGDITNNEAFPEYNGYYTMVTRKQRVSMQPKTKAVYLPLIDMTPSDPDTIMTTLHEAKRPTKERGQKNAIFTSDQQLYKVAVEVQWVYPREFSDGISRLGGMHTLMSFAGAIGTLMQGSGLSEVLESTFAGVTEMLPGKKFPQNIRAMRLVLEEMLRSTMSDGSISTMEELLTRLDHAASASNTSKLWVDCFNKPVFIMMLYIRAEQQGDWPLHLVSLKQMLPYFFASSHVNYARYGLYYLRSICVQSA